MPHFLPRLALAAFLLLSAPALADFDAGKKAYAAREWSKAIAELRPLAEAGDSRAMVLLGNMYNDGSGVLVSGAEAMRLYRRAAELHNTDAMVALAAMYQGGLGVKADPKRARAWFERAAALGNQAGAFFYAIALFHGGDGFEQDFKGAYKWFRIAKRMTAYDNVSEAAAEMAKIVAGKVLTLDVVRINQEIAVWQPADPATLGPLPEEETAPKPQPPQ